MAAAGKAPRRLNPDACKVHVFGYPPYTQPQDLSRAFIHFGNVQIDKINQKFASLVFSNPLEAKSALQASKKVSIYGTLLTVKTYNPELNAGGGGGKQNSPKRNFTKTKESEEIINPKDIDLSGDFHQQMDKILAAVRLTQEEVTAISSLYADLQAVLQSLWPGCEAVPFGSIPTGLAIKSSDADCFISLPPSCRHPSINYVQKTQRILRQYPGQFSELLCIPRANTPLVKFLHTRTNTRCDVSFKTPLGARNSSLVAFLLRGDPRVLPLAVLVKYWARVHKLSGCGRLSNYALVLLIIAYLQSPRAGLLPSIQRLQQDVPEQIVDHWNTSFNDGPLTTPTGTPTLADLLGGFFEYYALFDFESMIVCPYLGHPVPKTAFQNLDSLPEGFERYEKNVRGRLTPAMRFTTPFCVQDPFEQSHNVASSIGTRLADEIKAYFKFAADAYDKEKSNNFENFLETILLQRPKIAKVKGNPEFRSNLFPNMVSSIVAPDWKAVVRDVVFVIFEQMLKIKLGKVEEKTNPDSRKEKEKYLGSLAKPIWRRKQFNKVYSVVPLDLQEKQARITDEIMNTDKERINVTFQTTLTFCHEPRSAVVAIKMASGDLLAFKDFGRFFVTVLQNWFLQLVRPARRDVRVADTIRCIDNAANDSDDSDDDDTATATSAASATAPTPTATAPTPTPAPA